MFDTKKIRVPISIDSKLLGRFKTKINTLIGTSVIRFGRENFGLGRLNGLS